MSTTTIPVHPQPSFYETTQAPVATADGLPGVITHEGYQQIVDRPKWDQVEAEQRIFKGKVKRSTGKRRARPIRRSPASPPTKSKAGR